MVRQQLRGYLAGLAQAKAEWGCTHERKILYDAFEEGDLGLDHLPVRIQVSLPEEDTDEATRVLRFPKYSLLVPGVKSLTLSIFRRLISLRTGREFQCQ